MKHKEDNGITIIKIILLFFGSFAIFSYSLVKALTEFEKNNLILFFSLILIGLIILIITLSIIFKKKKFAFAFI